MNHTQLAGELKLAHGFLSLTRLREISPDATEGAEAGCALRMLNRCFAGETLLLHGGSLGCAGAGAGFGFTDGLPEVPGGFGHFLSMGRGEGYPPGERVKCSPELGEEMLLAQPQGVMAGFRGIRIKPYATDDAADVVTALVTMDQLAALIHLFCYRSARYDDVIVPMVSGCASVFRIPFGELDQGSRRGVVGNIDVFSRPHFPAGTAFFTVPGTAFAQMLADAEESMLAAPIWKGVQARL